MGTVTISLEDDVEERFREQARQEYGKGKGVLKEAITKAIEKWMDGIEQNEITQRQLKLMDKGFTMGKSLYKNRDELHDRNL